MTTNPDSPRPRLSVLLCSEAVPPATDATDASAAAAFARLVSLAGDLASAGTAVTVLLRTPLAQRDAGAGAELLALHGVDVAEPERKGGRGKLSRAEFARWVERRARAHHANLDPGDARIDGSDMAVADAQPVISLGHALSLALAERAPLQGRLCAVLDDAPATPIELTERRRAELSTIAVFARVCAVPTEDARSLLEAEIGEFAGKTTLLATGKRETDGIGFATVLERAFGRRSLGASNDRALRILVAGYDFKFMGELVDVFARDPAVDLSYDKWPGTGTRSRPVAKELFHSADIVFCEWSAANAVWYSRHKRPGQKLVVRLHRFEMDRPWVHQIDYANVDAFVVVAEHMAERMRAETDVDPARLHVIPNMVDVHDFDRAKVPGAEFRVGIAGIVPVRKRPDRALALARELRRLDPRFTLHVRGRLPSTYAEFSSDGFFRLYYQHLFRQIMRPEDLQGVVVPEGFGSDMANWFRRIGWILSPSSDESFHLAVAEGMASGALPVVWDWRGAAQIYRPEDVYVDDPAAIAEHMVETARSGTWTERSLEAQRFVERYDSERIGELWIRLFRSLRGEDVGA